MIGFQENRANELLVADGKLTGEVREPILGRATKLATLIELTRKFDLAPENTLNPEVKSQPQPDKVTVDTEQVEGMAEQVELVDMTPEALRRRGRPSAGRA